MRLTKKLCALVSSFAVGASAQGVPQPPAPGTPASDGQLRDALRKALQGDTPAPAERPVTPAVTSPAILTPATPTVPTTNITTLSPRTTTAFSLTNVIYDTNGMPMIPLSLADAIRLALERNLELRVARYNPIISEYTRRALYGYYDPTFNSAYSRINSEREAGGINLNTGNATPGTSTEVDQITAGLNGYLPSGMSYGVTHNVLQNNVVTPIVIGTDPITGQPIFGTRENNTWSSATALTVTQPLLRDLWIDNPRLQIKLARRNQTIAQLGWERTIMDIANRVEQAYYQLSAAREAVRAGEADLALKKQFFDEQRRRVEVGTIASLEEKLAQAEVAKSESNLIGLRGQASDAEVILKGLIHDDVIGQIKVRIHLIDRLVALPTVADLYESLREADQKRPDLQQQRLVLEKWRLQLKYDFNQLFPRLDIFGTLGFNGLDTQFGGALQDIRDRNFEQRVVGVSVSVPLSMWTPRNIYKADKAAQAQALWEYKRQTEVVYGEVEVQIRLINTLWAQIPLTREVAASQQQALDAERKKFDAGKSTSFQVLQIASGLTTAQVNEIRAMLIYNQALSELEFRKGTTLQRWHIDVTSPID